MTVNDQCFSPRRKRHAASAFNVVIAYIDAEGAQRLVCVEFAA